MSERNDPTEEQLEKMLTPEGEPTPKERLEQERKAMYEQRKSEQRY